MTRAWHVYLEDVTVVLKGLLQLEGVPSLQEVLPSLQIRLLQGFWGFRFDLVLGDVGKRAPI